MSKLDYVVWNDEYSVGIAVLDEQHRQILNLINDLYNAKDYSQDGLAVWHLLSVLRDYTMTHFAEEEAMMKRCGYRDFDHHKIIHDQLRENTEQLCKAQRDVMRDLSFEVLNFLRKWWTQHILGMDRKYAPCVSSQGVI